MRGRALSESELERASVALAQSLMEQAATLRRAAEAERERLLSRLMNDADGQAFTTCLTDRAFRSRDPDLIVDTARHLLRRLGVPGYLPAAARGQLQLLLRAGPFLPRLAAKGLIARLHHETEHVVLPAEEPQLSEHLALRRDQGVRVNLNLLGEVVLGEREAARRSEEYLALLARPDVEAISIKLSSIASQIELLAFQASLDELAPRLRRIYAAARTQHFRRADGRSAPKLVNLDMEAYRDLELTYALFTRLMAEPELHDLSAGLVLQAYLPDSFDYQQRLTAFARERLASGGAPLRLRIVKGANLASERVESALRGWPLPMYANKPEVDANYIRMLEFGCRPENAAALQIGLASHNVFDVALGLCLRNLHGLGDALSFELLEGMADPLRRALQSLGVDVLVYCPIVAPSSMQTAIAYLTRRLDENTAPENFLRNAFGMRVGDAAWQNEERRFREAMALRRDVSQQPRRDQDRRNDVSGRQPSEPFQNEPDTDFALAANRIWIAELLERWQSRPTFELPMRIAGGTLLTGALRDGFDPSRPDSCPYRHPLATEQQIELAIATASAAADGGVRPVRQRFAWLEGVARGLRRQRGELIAAMVLDAGKRVEQADGEVSEAIDFAEYYARNFEAHARDPELALAPKGVVVVTPPWNFPLAIPASGTLAALMAGNAVILKPALETPLVAERLAAVCYEAGVPPELLQLVFCEDELGSQLIRDPRVASVVLTGATSTARKFHALRPGLDLMAETGGKNAVVVCASADRDLAVKELLAAAFAHAGQKCSAASLLICLPELYDDPSFAEVLRDACASLTVGPAWDPRSLVTPLIQPPAGPLLRAISSLEPGERWLVEPRRDPDNPRLISPGIKYDVAAGSFTHLTELFGPMLGVMRANDLDHAIELVEATPYGLTSGLFSLDEREQQRWAERVSAGNLYINRTITGAIVRRQPFGGWKASSFGTGAKAGGPNYVLQLCRIADGRGEAQVTAPQPDAAALMSALRERLDPPSRERIARAACSYAHALREHFLVGQDPSQLIGERNELRYRPLDSLLIRAAPDAALGPVLLATVAALSAGAGVTLSIDPRCAGDDRWLANLPLCDPAIEPVEAAVGRLGAGVQRVRAIGSPEQPLMAAAVERGIHVASQPVLTVGRVELLHSLREQALSNAYHRYGSLHQAALL